MTSFTRRRFLKISVATSAAMLAPNAISLAKSELTIWNGIVLGASASIRVYGNKKDAQAAINKALEVIQYQEKQFSIYDPKSSLSKLNETSILKFDREQGKPIYDLINISRLINQNTNGLFDPTIQPLFEAYAKAQGYPMSESLKAAQVFVGIKGVDTSLSSQIKFKRKGMALTFNGIAQGFITDKVRQEMDRLGFYHALVNIGEYSIGNDQAKIGIASSTGEVFDVVNLHNQAIATSSPSGYRFLDGTSHIIHPDGKRHIAHWDSVSVIANNATLADGYSTALTLTNNTKLAEKLVKYRIIEKVVLKDLAGRVHYIE